MSTFPSHQRVTAFIFLLWERSRPRMGVLVSYYVFWISMQIADLANEDTPQLYVACGRGPRSSLRVLRHGLEVRSPI